MPVGVMIANSDSSLIVANRVAKNLFGLEGRVDSLNAKDIFSSFTDAARFEKMLDAASSAGLVHFDFDVEEGTPGKLQVEISKRLFNNSYCFFIIIFGNSGTVSIGNENPSVNTDAGLLEYMKSEFIAIASHELRTPLSVIKGYCEAFIYNELGDLTRHQLEKMKIINDRADQMVEIINDLLDVRRLELGRITGDFVNVPVGDLLRNVVDGFQMSAGIKSVRLEECVEEDLPYVRCDRSRINQVLENLISNSIKNTSEGGVVTVCAGLDSELESFVFSVSDSGCGISCESGDRLFEPFFQEESSLIRRGGGLGLGLLIARAIVEEHGGKLWYTSKENVSTTFFFTIPALAV